MCLPAQRWRSFALPVFLLAYFIFFTYDGLLVHFAIDDIGNMAHYWRGGPLALAVSQFTIWHGDYRPAGGLFYLPILAFAGLDPVPYQVALLLILLVNAYFVYRLARRLGCCEWIAALAALVACYHAGLHNLYYNAAFVYDALCCFFYLAACLYYMRIRQSGGGLNAWQITAFLALVLGALNSKEMAVTLPLMLLVYEWIYHRPERADAAWITGTLRGVVVASILTAVDVFGKLFGPDALAHADGYRPVLALGRVRDFQRIMLGDLLFGWGSGWGGILLLYAVLAFLAWRRDRPALRFLWWFLVLTPLPIEFLIGKSQACLYVPMVGWAIFGAMIFVDLVNSLARLLEREPFGRSLGHRGVAILLTVLAVSWWARTNLHHKRVFAKPVMNALGQESCAVIEQFRALNPHVAPRSSVIFLDDPFHSWDMLFVAELWFRDHSLDIRVQRHGPPSPADLAQAKAVFTFENGKMIQLR